ncbi:MAG: efflux transporter outer membrane subunit [Prevotella sp.]|nr:efflux transporter outer membrane subunit [Prevotella sp.]
MKKIFLFSVAALLMTSCGLYNKYERPEVNTQGLVRDPLSLTDTLVVSDTTSFGRLPWRQVFTDSQLQSLIQQALDNNPDLLNAALNVKMAEAQLMASKLAFLPQLTFTPQGTIASWDGNKPSKTYQMPVAASWNVDLFGNLLSQKRGAQVALLATKDYQTVVQANIISGVANMYYTLMMLDAQVEVITGMEELMQKTWQLMLDLKGTKAGYTEAAVTSAEANYLSVRAQKVDLLRQIREVENSLSLVLGQPAQTIQRGRLDEQSLPEEFSTGVSLQLLSNRADVHAAEMQLAQCFYGVETARSRFYPSITITPSGTFTNSAGTMVVNPGKWMLSAVGSLVQPIFMRGQLVAGLKVAKAQYEQAYNTWQASVLSAGSEVSNALVLYNSSAEKSSIEDLQIKALESNLTATTELFHLRGGTYLEMIQSQSSLLNARISKISDDFSKMQAVVNLYQALGGGAK